MGINRNIVECKSKTYICTSAGTSSINRNIVECKFGRFRVDWLLRRVLIETLWNVN